MPMFLMSFNYVKEQKDQNSEMWQFVGYLWSPILQNSGNSRKQFVLSRFIVQFLDISG